MNRPLDGLRRHPIALGIAGAVLLLIAGLAICEARGWPFLRGPLQRTLSKQLDRDVQVGSGFRLHLLGAVRLKTDSLTIGPPRWADTPTADAPKGVPADRFFDAHDVVLQLPWSTVWHLMGSNKSQPIHVSTLEVGDFDAALWRRADGHANWEFSLPKKNSSEPAQMPEFDSLLVHNGHLTLDDAPTGVTLDAKASTTEGEAKNTGAGLQVDGRGQYRQGRFTFGVHSNGVLPLIAPEGASVSVPITVRGQMPDAQLKFDGQAQDVIHLREMSGRFVLSGTSLAKAGEPFGITLPTTAKFDMEGQVSKNGEVWKADIGRFEVGSSRLGGDFTFDQRPRVPMLTGVLRGRNLDLKDLGPAFGAPAPGAGNPAKPEGKVFPEREFDIPSLKAMNADVKVDLQRADLHTSYLQPLQPLRARVRLDGSVLSIDDLLAHTSGGDIRGRLVLDGRVTDKPRWSGDLQMAGVQLEDWLKITDTHAKPAQAAEQGKPPATRYVTGRLGGHVKFTGTGRSIAHMLGSLDGTVAAWVNQGSVSHLALEALGIDVAQALGVLVKGDDALKMQCAAAQFTARNGELHSDVGVVDTTDTTMLIGGDLSLAKEQFALVAQAYPKDFSPAALRTPIHLDGPFAHPQVHLETKRIAGKAAVAVALGTLVNPLAALIPLIDPGQKAPIGCQQALDHMRMPGAKASPPEASPRHAGTPAGKR